MLWLWAIAATVACLAMLALLRRATHAASGKRSEAQEMLALAYAEREEALRGLDQQLTEVKRRAEDAERKAAEYFEKIEGIVAEANKAREGHINASVEHGHAQAMMLRERERLVIQYRGLQALFKQRTGEAAPEPQLNPLIETVADDFRNHHVITAAAAAVEAAAKPGSDKPALSPPAPASG